MYNYLNQKNTSTILKKKYPVNAVEQNGSHCRVLYSLFTKEYT